MRSFAIGAIGIILASFCLAQDRRIVSAAGDKYVISAKAGGVNYVEGSVGIVRKAGTSGHLISGHLIKGDTLEIGDRVTAGSDGKAEILLNPGSYLRLGPGAEFEFKTTSLDDLQLRLDRGSAMFEVFASNEFKVLVSTPKANVLLVESGVFRVDVLADGSGKISVWSGKAELGDANATIINKGRSATVNGDTAKVSKFDRNTKDELVAWSKVRAKQLADASASLRNNQNVRTSLMSSFLGGGWGMYNSFGLWIFDARFGGYCFLPFGMGWYSPYGFGYGNCSCYYHLPPVVYYQPYYGPPVSPTVPATVRIATMGDRTPTPPFVRMQQSGGGGLRGGGNVGSPRSDPGTTYSPPSTSSPSYSPPPESRPAPSSPPPAAQDTARPRKDGR